MRGCRPCVASGAGEPCGGRRSSAPCCCRCSSSRARSAGTTGKLSGRVLDKKKQPLAGANVAIPAARLGAASDAEGRFAIIGIPAGTYEVKVNLLGYGPVAVEDVRISADNTTALDVELAEAPVLMKEVVVSAQRPVVDLKLTSTMATREPRGPQAPAGAGAAGRREPAGRRGGRPLPRRAPGRGPVPGGRRLA